MGEKNKQSNKIGARCLTEQEAELILPTYKQIYNQLETFREEKNIGNSNDQKTNNIGIIGVRGAGKTSILKTISAKLEADRMSDDRPQDIILPIIVPENMSESATLMATVLGMLSDIVEKRAKEEKGTRCIGKTELEQKCHNVLKQYTYIQKEYRDILIQQYTSPNEYARSSAKLFNSDPEFIMRFNELIDELVGKGSKNQNLLVLFIDDIDLSTWRCMDVVRTLLSYLANKNIVTFISGDLDTFDEALTLEFLRQEKALDGGILNQPILTKGVKEKKLLESKKQLAYEYLKKVLPPVYRHNIKEWSLEERGKYCIQNSEKEPEASKLSELLSEALKGWVDSAFFQYSGSNGEKGILPYTYHLFDNTSRGLNNVYNVLIGIVESRKSGKTDREMNFYVKEKKQLLDTLIASHKIYNQYRNELWTQMMTVGTSPEASKVYFDNAYSIIYKKMANGERENYKIEEPVERFSLFILVDFAARLLYESKKYAEIIEKDEGYQKIKREAIWDLFWHPIIAEKVMEVDGNGFIDAETARKSTRRLRGINIGFLEKGELVFSLAYYMNLPLERLFPLYQKTNSPTSSADLDQQVLGAFWKAVSSIAAVNDIEVVQKLGEYYYKFKNELDYFMGTASTSMQQNVAIRLFDRECKEIVETNSRMGDSVYRKRILQNTIAELLKTEIGCDDMEWEKVDSEKAWELKDNQLCEVKDIEKQKRRIAVLKAVHEQGLWREEMAEVPIGYLKKEIAQYLVHIDEELTKTYRGINGTWVLDISRAEEDWRKFLNSYDGVGETKAYQTKQVVLNFLAKDEGGSTEAFTKGISFRTYEEIRKSLGMLADNNRVWYGQYDAWKINMDLWEAWARPTEGWDASRKYSYIKFLLQCCYRYKKVVEFEGENIEYARMLREIAEGVSKAHGYAYEKAQSTFMENLNSKLKESNEKPVDDEEFNKLFSGK